MKQYIKNDTIKMANNIIIKKDGFQIINPNEQQLLDDGWIKYTQPELSEIEIFNQKKQELVDNINIYDSSNEVNVCYIKYNDVVFPYWANKLERGSLKSAVQDCISNGRNQYRLDLRDLQMSIVIPCQVILDMLSKLEVYAIDCYNTTTDHLYNINNISNIEELDNYDYTLNYPEKLTFEI